MKNMKQLIRVLAGIAIIQVIFIFFTHMGGNTLNQYKAHEPVLAFDHAAIDQLVISNGDKQDDKHNNDNESPVILLKKEGKWQTESGFPVAEGKVDQLLDKLGHLKAGLPVATSADALKRFKVANDSYERMITLKQGDKKLASLYLGSGAGVGQSHARSDTQAAVYTVELGTYDVPTSIDDWLDKGVLKLTTGQISEVNLAGTSFKTNQSAKKDKMTIWTTDKLPDDKLINQKAINDSLGRVASLSFTKLLGKEKKPEYELDKPVLAFSLNHEGKTRNYQFAKIKDKEDYVLKISDRDEYFQIANYTADPLIEKMTVKKWLLDKEKPEATKAEATKAEATKAEATKAEATKAEATKAEATKAEKTANKEPETAQSTSDNPVEPLEKEASKQEPVEQKQVQKTETEPVAAILKDESVSKTDSTPVSPSGSASAQTHSTKQQEQPIQQEKSPSQVQINEESNNETEK